MTDSKPLHVEVACALGWTECQDRGDGLWLGRPKPMSSIQEIPGYGKTACSTGALLERFNLSVGRSVLLNEDKTPSRWVAISGKIICDGTTPWEAIGLLLVELAKKGKLIV